MRFCCDSRHPSAVDFSNTLTDIFSFMEGARMRSSVALPREVAKPSVIQDHDEKITLKAGQEVMCNLVWPRPRSYPTFSPDLPTPSRSRRRWILWRSPSPTPSS